jgi:hypothetical protein
MSARTIAVTVMIVVQFVAIVVLLIVSVPRSSIPTRQPPPPAISWQCEDALARRRNAEDAVVRPAPDTSRTAARSNLTRAEAAVKQFCPK